MRTRDLILWLGLCLIWGSSYLLIKISVEGMTPFVMVLIRMTVASTMMVAVIRWRHIELSEIWSAKWLCAFSGLSGSVFPFFLIAYGEQNLPSSIAVLIMGTMPIATVALAPMMIADERYNGWILLSVLMGIIGLYLTAFYDLQSASQAQLASFAAIFAAAMCYASQNLILSKFRGKHAPMVLASGSIIMGTIIAWALAPFVVTSWSVRMPALASAATLGILATGVATILFFNLLANLGPQVMSLVNFMVPLLGVFLGVTILHEPLRWNLVLAAIFILSGLFFGLIRARSKPKAAPHSSGA